MTSLRHLALRGLGGGQAREDRFRSLTSLDNVARLHHLCLAGFVGNGSFKAIVQRHGETLHWLHLDLPAFGHVRLQRPTAVSQERLRKKRENFHAGTDCGSTLWSRHPLAGWNRLTLSLLIRRAQKIGSTRTMCSMDFGITSDKQDQEKVQVLGC